MYMTFLECKIKIFTTSLLCFWWFVYIASSISVLMALFFS